MFTFNKKKDSVKATDKYITEENEIRICIVELLKKKETRVSMAPISQKYFILNKSIDFCILVDGSAELVKTTNHKFKYGWKFREAFINELIKLIIDWIENDRSKIEKEIFINEMNLLTDIKSLISSLDNTTEEIPREPEFFGCAD
jgi:hypothetical protein